MDFHHNDTFYQWQIVITMINSYHSDKEAIHVRAGECKAYFSKKVVWCSIDIIVTAQQQPQPQQQNNQNCSWVETK